LIVAVVAVELGSMGHERVGSSLWPLVAAFLGVAAASWVLARWEASGPTLLCWLGVGQLLIHLVMTAGGPAGAAPARAVLYDVGWHILALGLSALTLRTGEAGLWAAHRLRTLRGRLSRYLTLLESGITTEPRGLDELIVEGRAAAPAGDLARGWFGRRGPPTVLGTA
jgi:hypothetical protein